MRILKTVISLPMRIPEVAMKKKILDCRNRPIFHFLIDDMKQKDRD